MFFVEETSLLGVGLEEHHAVPEREQHEVLQGKFIKRNTRLSSGDL